LAHELLNLAPELLLAGLALLVLLIGVISRRTARATGHVAIAGMLVVAVLVLLRIYETDSYWYDTFVIDAASQLFKLVFLAVGILVGIASLKRFGKQARTEYFSLILFAILGMFVVASANDLLMLFVGFETASLSTYALAAFTKREKRSMEAALKYFLIGAFSSAIMLFGISYVYGATGTTYLPGIAAALAEVEGVSSGLVVGMLFLVAGFGFKMALVPFHFWVPDTYEGAPTAITAFLAAGSKKMGFIAAFRVFFVALVALKVEWSMVFAVLAVATMFLGNAAAIPQRSVKRMLAYSSVAQAGYIAMAFVILTPYAVAGGLLYVIGHAFMKIGAFAVVMVVAAVVVDKAVSANRRHDIEQYAGLYRRAPFLALSMTVFLFALAGIPPTVGFISKFVIFSAAIDADMAWLAIIAIVNSALSLYYYARVVKYMYAKEPQKGATGRVRVPRTYILVIAVTLFFVFLIGVWPQPFLDFCITAAQVFF